MVRQNSVKAAFSKPNDVRAGTPCITKCCRCFCLFISLLVFLMILGAGSGPISDNELSGQAHHTTTKQASYTTPSSSSTSASTSGGKDFDTSAWQYNDNQDVDSAVGEVSQVLQTAEEEALLEEKTMLQKAVKAGGKALRAGIWKVLGAGASNQEVEALAEEVESELVTEAMDEMKKEADEAVEYEIIDVNNMVDEEEYNGMDASSIRQSVRSREDYYKDDIRSRIGDIENDLQSSLSQRSLDLEKKLLEEKLSTAYGTTIHLDVVAGEIQQPVEKYDDGIGNLRGSTTSGYGGTTTSSTTGYGGTYGGTTPSTSTTSSGYSGGTATSSYGGAVPTTAADDDDDDNADGDDDSGHDDDNTMGDDDGTGGDDDTVGNDSAGDGGKDDDTNGDDGMR